MTTKFFTIEHKNTLLQKNEGIFVHRGICDFDPLVIFSPKEVEEIICVVH
jgi:hypothetical protein